MNELHGLIERPFVIGIPRQDPPALLA